jgi:TolB-like protein
LQDKTVAILPFKDLSENNDQSNFIEGMGMEIRYHLSKLNDIQLLYDNLNYNNIDFKKNGNDYTGKLKVDYLVLGEVSKAGDLIRISARIVQGSTGKVVWFQVYNEKIINSSQVLEIQAKIALEIVSGLEAQINQEFAKSNDKLPYRNR